LSPDRFLKTIAAALLSSLLLPGPRARGDEFRVVPSIAAKDEYNSNIFFTTGARTDSFIITVSPRLEVSDRTERLDVLLDAGADRLFYSTDEELDTWDQRYRGALGYRISDRFRLSGDASWRREGRPDRDIATTGQLVGSRSDRLNGSATIDFVLGEKIGGGLSYGYDRIEYQNQENVDSEQHTVGLGFTHHLGQYLSNTKARANLGYSRSTFTGADVESYTMTVGFSREIHELWSMLADVGARYTWSQFDVQGTESSNDTGWIAKVALAYKGERDTGNLSFNRDVTVAAGQGGAVERTSVTLGLAHRGSYEFTGLFSTGYYWNRSEAGQFSGQAIDEQTVQVRPGLRYAATKNIDVEAAYQYTRILFRQTDTAASQNVVYLRAALRYPVVE
jgi:opacity protein-like surface antigen